MLLVFVGCSKTDKYSYQISDFKPNLRGHIQRIIDKGHLPYTTDSLTMSFLEDSCTKDELISLLNFESPLVRVVAFRAIVNRNEPDYFPILLSHLDDTVKVEWWYFDDAANDFMVSDLMIRKVESDKKLSRLQKDSLIDVVLTHHQYLKTAEWMINDIEPKDKYYSNIRSMAQRKLNDCHDLSNTYALAKYKKQEDIPLIKKNFSEFSDNPFCNNNYFMAFEVFPDTAFFPYLVKYFDKFVKKQKQDYSKDLKYYCRAVAQYRTKQSLSILIALTKKGTYPDSWYLKYNQEYVFKAIYKYKSPIYDSLFNALKPRMSEFVMKYIDKPDYDEYPTW